MLAIFGGLTCMKCSQNYKIIVESSVIYNWNVDIQSGVKDLTPLRFFNYIYGTVIKFSKLVSKMILKLKFPQKWTFVKIKEFCIFDGLEQKSGQNLKIKYSSLIHYWKAQHSEIFNMILYLKPLEKKLSKTNKNIHKIKCDYYICFI